MKKTFLIAVLAVGVTLTTSGQGTTTGKATFVSSGHASGKGLISDQFGALLGASASSSPFTTSQYKAELFGGLSSDQGTWTVLDTATTFVFFTPGEVNGGTITVNNGNALPLNYMVRAWDTTTGATFGLATVRGASSVAAITLSDDSVAPLPTPPNINNWNSFQLAVVPEPSTILLGLLGGAGMLFRRRK